MALNNHCPYCGIEIPANAPDGVCPQCLMKAGIENDIDVTTDPSYMIEGPGTKIGRYELLMLIGEGGMGLVYLAEQKEPVKRKVALKIVKLGMDTKQVVARFEAERQALALLDHPNIAKVFDAGATETGRPYFVMEYVKGMSIIRYCDEHRLDIEQRLKLFREVCEGVHHAHQKGIIHRDIKPSNILVSMHGDRVVPKIIDFGIAKAATSTLTEKTMFTFQGQLLGTPEYMSPEQVDIATQDIDTRSDIYSLGVVLYELLAGILPFERESLHNIGFTELQRTLRELEPASPSIRLSNLGKQAKTIADNRMTQVVPLARRLHRELEWIPLKAMRKDRCRRYKSASEMADDIHSYLNGNPLIAGPETTVYRARKFVHKHVGSVTTVVLVTFALILGLVASAIFGCRAEQARQQEALVRKQVEQALARAEKAEKIAQERADRFKNLSYLHSVALADVKYREGNLRNARELLKSCPEDLRNWEWYRLNSVTDESVFTIAPGFPAISIAFSPDGKRIASGNLMGGQIKVWDVETKAEVQTLEGHKTKAILSVKFSPDGTKIASSSADCTIKLWDIEKGQEIMTLEGHQKPVRSIAFSPDGNKITSGSFDSTVKLWDVSTGKELRTLSGHNDIVCCVAFSPDGRHIASGSYDQTVKIWDAKTGKELKTFNVANQKILGISYSSDSKRIAVSCFGGAIRVLDAMNGTQLLAPNGHTKNKPVMSIDFSPDGKRIVSGSYDNTVKIWDGITGKELTTFIGHAKGVGCVVFSPDGEHVASAALPPGPGEIKIWDVSTDKERMILRDHEQSVCSLSFTPDGKRLLTASIDGTIKIWNVSDKKVIKTLSGHKGPIFCISTSSDSKYALSGGDDMTLRIWSIPDGQEVRKFTGHNKAIYSVAFSQDGSRVLSGSADGTAKIWDRASGEELLSLSGPKQGVLCVAFSPDGTRLVTGGIEIGAEIKLWDASSGNEIMKLSGHESGVRSILFTPDSRRIVSGSGDATIRFWDTLSGEELMTLYGHKDYIEQLAISPDGTRIVSCSHDGTTKVWDTFTGTELMTISSWSRDIVFSPDGKMIVGAGGPKEGDISLWQSGT